MAAPPPPATGNPWLVVLTIGLAVIVLALVAFGLRAAAGRSTKTDVVEVPARRDIVPPPSTTPRSSPTSRPPGAPSTTLPGNPGSPSSTVPTLDLTTPRITVTDADGRFAVTVPRTWLNVPTSQPDQNQWVPLAPLPTGDLAQTQYVFAVRWAAAGGCNLEQCTAQVVDPLKATYPGISPVITADRIGGLPAMRIEASAGDQRLVAWVVVEGDRYWVPQLRGPPDGFDVILAVVRPIVVSMSFG